MSEIPHIELHRQLAEAFGTHLREGTAESGRRVDEVLRRLSEARYQQST